MRDNTKRSKIPLACGALMLAAVGIWAVSKACGTGSGDIPGATNEQRTAYIESFGWDPGITHTDVSEIRIPVEFDEVYEEYNDLQKKQGFDLRKYRAHTVKRYTYELAGDSAVPLCAELLVDNGVIIGADITTPTAGGFMGALAVEED